MLDSVKSAIEATRRGDVVLVVDDEHRENEGDLILPADAATTDAIAFMLRHTSGVVCVSMTGERLDRLGLPPMVAANRESQRTAFTVSVDAAAGVTTGISATDRAVTLRTLADPAARRDDLVRPGHIFPLRSRPGGVLERPGHTEAAIDLARLAGRASAGVLCEVTTADKSAMAGARELRHLADTHGIPLISVADLAAHRLRTERMLTERVDARLPTPFGEFTAHVWRSSVNSTEQMCLSLGNLANGSPPLVRIHGECLTGDVFASSRCDCRKRLHESLSAISSEGRGVLAYLRGPAGRGLQPCLALRPREYGIAAEMLRDLGVHHVRRLTHDLAGSAALHDFGLDVIG
jgi:3,4-dihydroxy 2-butanone 4-phosphate synthase / GTP cyclohydrolase II